MADFTQLRTPADIGRLREEGLGEIAERYYQDVTDADLKWVLSSELKEAGYELGEGSFAQGVLNGTRPLAKHKVAAWRQRLDAEDDEAGHPRLSEEFRWEELFTSDCDGLLSDEPGAPEGGEADGTQPLPIPEPWEPGEGPDRSSPASADYLRAALAAAIHSPEGGLTVLEGMGISVQLMTPAALIQALKMAGVVTTSVEVPSVSWTDDQDGRHVQEPRGYTFGPVVIVSGTPGKNPRVQFELIPIEPPSEKA